MLNSSEMVSFSVNYELITKENWPNVVTYRKLMLLMIKSVCTTAEIIFM